MASTIHEAPKDEIPVIVDLLRDMQDELHALPFDKAAYTDSITESFDENVVWFLFRDENNEIFGTCYMQSVHNYWRREKRYYLGGFYIKPSHRGQGRFRAVNEQLKTWAHAHNGIEIYAHIHQDNEKSLNTFASAGLGNIGYLLCVHYWGEQTL